MDGGVVSGFGMGAVCAVVLMVKIGAQWFESGKVHKKTQMPLGFFRGEITCGQVTRFTLRKFAVRDDAELYALSVTLRYRGIFAPSPVLPLRAHVPQMQERHLGEGG